MLLFRQEKRIMSLFKGEGFQWERSGSVFVLLYTRHIFVYNLIKHESSANHFLVTKPFFDTIYRSI